jgi:hypothetical protein
VLGNPKPLLVGEARLKPNDSNTRWASNFLSVSKLGRGVLPGWLGLQLSQLRHHKIFSQFTPSPLHTYLVFFCKASTKAKFKPF